MKKIRTGLVLSAIIVSGVGSTPRAEAFDLGSLFSKAKGMVSNFVSTVSGNKKSKSEEAEQGKSVLKDLASDIEELAKEKRTKSRSADAKELLGEALDALNAEEKITSNSSAVSAAKTAVNSAKDNPYTSRMNKAVTALRTAAG